MTMQTPDFLFWNSEEHCIVESELIFNKVFPDINFPEFDKSYSNCWRGYVATWIIDSDDWLKLSKINLYAPPNEQNEIFAIFRCDLPVCASAFTGQVTAGFGEEIRQFGMYEKSYPHYRVFHFDNGLLAHVDEHDRDWWESGRQPYELPAFLRE